MQAAVPAADTQSGGGRNKKGKGGGNWSNDGGKRGKGGKGSKGGKGGKGNGGECKVFMDLRIKNKNKNKNDGYGDDGGFGAAPDGNAIDKLSEVSDAIEWMDQVTTRAIRIDELKRLMDKPPRVLLPSIIATANEVVNVYNSFKGWYDIAVAQRRILQPEAIAAQLSGKFTDSQAPGIPVDDETQIKQLLLDRRLEYSGVLVSSLLASHNGAMRRKVADTAERRGFGPNVAVSGAFTQVLFDRAKSTFLCMYLAGNQSTRWFISFRISKSSLRPINADVFPDSDLQQHLVGPGMELLGYTTAEEVLEKVMGRPPTVSLRRSAAGRSRTRTANVL